MRREEIQKKKVDTDKNAASGKPVSKQYKNEKSDVYIQKKFDRELKEAE